MARSLKKGPYVHHSLEKKVMKNIEEKIKVLEDLEGTQMRLLDYEF